MPMSTDSLMMHPWSDLRISCPVHCTINEKIKSKSLKAVFKKSSQEVSLIFKLLDMYVQDIFIIYKH